MKLEAGTPDTPRHKGRSIASGADVRGPLRFGDDPLLWASWLYYEEGMTQGDIADTMNVSRASINAYLAEARDKGIVNISIEGDRLKSLSLARQLQDHFGLRDCLVIPGSGPGRPLYERLGSAGAQALRWILRSGDRVGITWGQTMLALANSVPGLNLTDMKVVQATGGTTAPILYTPEVCARHLAEALGAQCIPISAPAMVSSSAVRDIIISESIVAHQLAELAAIECIIFSVSSLRPDSTIYTSGFIDPQLRQQGHYNSAVGTIAGRFIDAKGHPTLDPASDLTIGIKLEQIRTIRTRMAVAGGADKIPAMLAALRGEYVTVLVTDTATAYGLLRADGAEPALGAALRRRPEKPPGEGGESRKKKFLNSPRDAVSEAMDGALLAFPQYIEPIDGNNRQVRFSGPGKAGKVGLVIGGGAGHEPGFVGYVGQGLADACAVGNLFAAPPPDRVLACTRAVSTGQGILYVHGNYSGDVFNFSMAAELAMLEGIEVRTIVTTDDVASALIDDQDSRRGTAGTVFVFKVAGAACDLMYDLDTCERLARKANAQTFTMGVALEPMSLPETRLPSFRLDDDAMEVGVGIHGEPGLARERIMPADAIADRIFDTLAAEMKLSKGDRVALLVNSLGGTPMLELMILNRRIRQRLDAKAVEASLSLVGHYCTSLDMTGASISMMKLDDELLELLHHPCASFGWPGGAGQPLGA